MYIEVAQVSDTILVFIFSLSHWGVVGRTVFTCLLSHHVLSNYTLELSDLSLLKDVPFHFQML